MYSTENWLILGFQKMKQLLFFILMCFEKSTPYIYLKTKRKLQLLGMNIKALAPLNSSAIANY